MTGSIRYVGECQSTAPVVCFVAAVDSAGHPHSGVSEQVSAHLSLAAGSGMAA